VGLTQLAVTGPLLMFGDADGIRDLGALDVALAVGYLVAAVRPRRAIGMRSLVGAAALLLMTTASIDLITHRTSPVNEAPHLIAIAGWVLIVLLARLTPETNVPLSGERAWRERVPVWLSGWSIRHDVEPRGIASLGRRPAVAMERTQWAQAVIGEIDGRSPDMKKAVGE
jgi:hypothetical protein